MFDCRFGVLPKADDWLGSTAGAVVGKLLATGPGLGMLGGNAEGAAEPNVAFGEGSYAVWGGPALNDGGSA